MAQQCDSYPVYSFRMCGLAPRAAFRRQLWLQHNAWCGTYLALAWCVRAPWSQRAPLWEALVESTPYDVGDHPLSLIVDAWDQHRYPLKRPPRCHRRRWAWRQRRPSLRSSYCMHQVLRLFRATLADGSHGISARDLHHVQPVLAIRSLEAAIAAETVFAIPP